MNEIKCPECGNVVPENVKECPTCGYPIEVKENENKNENLTVENTVVNEESNIEKNKSVEKALKKFQIKNIKIMPLISLVIGVIMIIIGCKVMKQTADEKSVYAGDSYTAGHYNVADYTFGADFYSEIYEASNMIVDELDEINGNVASGFTDVNKAAETVTSSVNNIIDTIYYVAGILIIVLGMGTIAVACIHIKKE